MSKPDSIQPKASDDLDIGQPEPISQNSAEVIKNALAEFPFIRFEEIPESDRLSLSERLVEFFKLLKAPKPGEERPDLGHCPTNSLQGSLDQVNPCKRIVLHEGEPAWETEDSQAGSAAPLDPIGDAGDVLLETDAGVKALGAILFLKDAWEELAAPEREAAIVVLSEIIPVDPDADADLRRRNPVRVPDRRSNGKEAA